MAATQFLIFMIPVVGISLWHASETGAWWFAGIVIAGGLPAYLAFSRSRRGDAADADGKNHHMHGDTAA